METGEKRRAAMASLNTTKKGSGVRFNEGKVQWGLLPLASLEGCVRIFEFGAEKYSIGNWERGMSWRAVYESLQRHMASWQAGEELDLESGLPHIDHALCNLIMLSQYRKTFPEGDDRVSTLIKQQGIADAQEAQKEQSDAPKRSKGGVSASTLQGKCCSRQN